MRIKTLYVSVLACFLLIPAMTSGGILTGPVMNPANGHAYYLLTVNNWTASEAEAVILGGHLATVNDATEEAWIFSTFSTFGGQNRNLWIGLYDPDGRNNSSNQFTRRTEFRWISGAPVTFTAWSPLELNNPSPATRCRLRSCMSHLEPH